MTKQTRDDLIFGLLVYVAIQLAVIFLVVLVLRGT